MSLHKPNITQPTAIYHIFFHPAIILRYDSAYSELQLQLHSVVKYSINKINETLDHSCQLAKPNPHHDTPFSQSHLILSFHLRLGLQAIFFRSNFHMNHLHLFVIISVRVPLIIRLYFMTFKIINTKPMSYAVVTFLKRWA